MTAMAKAVVLVQFQPPRPIYASRALEVVAIYSSKTRFAQIVISRTMIERPADVYHDGTIKERGKDE